MPFFDRITKDFKKNKGNTKGKFFALLFRTYSLLHGNKVTAFIFIPYFIFYKFFVEWLMGIEIPGTTVIGKGLQVYHGQSIVVHKNVIIGENCVLRQCTTIGNATAEGGFPVIGNNVDIGCNVCIIGQINIGNNVVIGAGTVITKNVPSNCVIVGNPARIIKRIE